MTTIRHHAQAAAARRRGRASTLIATLLLNILAVTGRGVAGAPGELWVGGWFSDNVVRVDWKTGALLGTFVPAGAGGLVEAHDFELGPDGDLYVTSHGNDRVLRYDGETGAFLGVFVPPGDGMIRSHAVVWLADDTLIVSSELGHRVNQYDVDGTFLGQYVTPFQEGLTGPELIVAGPDGFLYLTAQSNQVLRLDPLEAGVVAPFVSDDPKTPEDETGGLNWAHGLAFGPDGNLYVASSNNNRILRYDGVTGAFMDAFVTGVGAPSFPVGVAFGPDGHLYVASFGNDRLLRYDGVSGAPLGVVADLGAMGVDGPLGIRFFDGPTCRPDLDGSGAVGTGDLIALLGRWGPCSRPCRQDLDRDGVVGTADLIVLLGRWGTCGD
jgi:DNA-binding beta-propeller fold protein YncE